MTHPTAWLMNNDMLLDGESPITAWERSLQLEWPALTLSGLTVIFHLGARRFSLKSDQLCYDLVIEVFVFTDWTYR